MRNTARWLVLASVIGWFGSGARGADERVEAMKTAKASADGALAVLRMEVKNQADSRTFSGMAICIDHEQGIFMTLAVPTGVRTENIASCELLVPGGSEVRVGSKLLGVEPTTRLAFIKVEELDKHSWKSVQFSASARLETGQTVASAGLMTGVPGLPVYVGAANFSADMRMPNHLAYVTGGTLTGTCSPVFNADGRAIGIVGPQLPLPYSTNTRRGESRLLLKSQDASYFFTPVDEFAWVLRDIPTEGKTRRPPWLGVHSLKAVDPEGDQAEVGIETGKVIPNQPAARAGIEAGDVIIAVNGEPIEKLPSPRHTSQEFNRMLMRKRVGEEVSLTVLRDGSRKEFKVTLRPLPQTADEAPQQFLGPLGVLVREKIMLDRYLDEGPTADVDGLIVVGVMRNSPAQAGGLFAQDVITHVGDVAVETIAEISAEVGKALQQYGVVRLTVRRGEDEVKVVVRPPARR